jgi:hypothetical protein
MTSVKITLNDVSSIEQKSDALQAHFGIKHNIFMTAYKSFTLLLDVITGQRGSARNIIVVMATIASNARENPKINPSQNSCKPLHIKPSNFAHFIDFDHLIKCANFHRQRLDINILLLFYCNIFCPAIAYSTDQNSATQRLTKTRKMSQTTHSDVKGVPKH